MSGPVPSPSTNGMIGRAGTRSDPPSIVIASPSPSGTLMNLYFDISSGSFRQRRHFPLRRARVLRFRPDQVVVGILFHDMCGPADHAGAGKDVGECIARNAQRVVHGRAEEVYVRVHLLTAPVHFL